MKDVEIFFRNKKADRDKLLDFGFGQDGDKYSKYIPIIDGEMSLIFECDLSGNIKTAVCDRATGDIYTLHLVGAEGEFVGRVRREYGENLRLIADACFNDEVFRFSQTEQIIEFAEKKYGDKPEFLWESTPDCAVLRRKDSGKWYAAILSVSGDKFKHNPEKDEIIDLRADPEEIDRVVDNVNYFRGYHMNKKSWLTIVLDGSVGTQEILMRLDDSYFLARNPRNRR